MRELQYTRSVKPVRKAAVMKLVSNSSMRRIEHETKQSIVDFVNAQK